MSFLRRRGRKARERDAGTDLAVGVIVAVGLARIESVGLPPAPRTSLAIPDELAPPRGTLSRDGKIEAVVKLTAEGQALADQLARVHGVPVEQLLASAYEAGLEELAPERSH